MEFTQYNCPVCDKKFESADDIVVCPECGTPHHRDCYDELGHCFYEDRHKEGFSFDSLHPEQPGGEQKEPEFEDFETILCPVCFHKNPGGTEVCQRCGTDLRSENAYNPQQPGNGQNNRQEGSPYQGMPFGFGASGMPQFDPLAGMDSKEEVGDNVTAGEAAKFTGKNTQYFSMVFQKLRKLGKGKFGFAAFIFSGVYFLYRKMYGIGIAFSLIVIATNVLSTFIIMTPEWSSAVRELAAASPDNIAGDPLYAYSLLGKMGYAYLPIILNGVRYVLMLISGLTANRIYYNHSMKRIRRIKDEYRGKSADELNKALEEKGGVNLPLALSFGITTVAISYICNFFIMSSSITA